jgi:hypothetical protein
MRPETRNTVIFDSLLRELEGEEQKTRTQIKRRLARAKLGPYKQEDVDNVRALHEALMEEVGKYHKSQYYCRAPGQFANIEDFDREKMAEDLGHRYPAIDKSDLRTMVELAVYLYYVR